MNDAELIARVARLEQALRPLRPDLHFPSTATLEQRLRWLEIVLAEMRAKDNRGIYAETFDEKKITELLHHTVYIKSDRITLMNLTADPASCAAGDQWFRSDLGKAKLAVDTVVADARILLRQGDRLTMTEIPDGTLGQVLTAQGAGVDPVYAAVAVDRGEGHICLIGYAYNAVVQGTWAIAIDTGQFCNGYVQNGNYNGDKVSYQAYLAAGTYTLSFLTQRLTNGAIVTFDIAGVDVASFDTYAAAPVKNYVVTQTGIAVATAGLVAIGVRANGHNASSSGYRVPITAFQLWRTS